MAATTGPDPPFWRGNLDVLFSLGFFAALALAVTITLASYDDFMRTQAATYDSAPTCSSVADISACRYADLGRIVGTSTSNRNLTVDVAFDKVDKVVTGALDQSYTSSWRTWKVDGTVDAELWHGQLVKVDGLKTRQNPDNYPVAGYRTAALAFAALTLVLAAVFGLLVVLYRRELNTRAEAAAGRVPGLHPLPLRPEMTYFLKREAGRVRNPAETTKAIIAAATLAAAILTALWIVNVAADATIAYIWLGCLTLGGLVTWWTVHDAWQSRQDLAGGVFIRATGPFSVRALPTRGGILVVVAVAGRRLPGVLSPLLETVESGSGTVDYLPHSGVLFAIRDESDNVLWSRFRQLEADEPAAAAFAQSAAR